MVDECFSFYSLTSILFLSVWGFVFEKSFVQIYFTSFFRNFSFFVVNIFFFFMQDTRNTTTFFNTFNPFFFLIFFFVPIIPSFNF